LTKELIKISNSIKELKITISKEEFDTVFYAELNKIKNQIKMPGFRPGRVPTKLLNQMHGPAIKIESQEQIAQNNFREYIETNKIDVIGTPSFTDIKENEDKSQTYTIKFETLPDFELQDYKSIEILEPYHKVTDEEIEKELINQSIHHGTKSSADLINDYNVTIVVDYHAILEETKEIDPTSILKNHQMNLYEERYNLFKDIFLNHKVGDEVEHITAESQPYSSANYTIKSIEQITPHIINDDFAQMASRGKFDNLEDFKLELGFEMQKY
jgi:trigger factor